MRDRENCERLYVHQACVDQRGWTDLDDWIGRLWSGILMEYEDGMRWDGMG